MWDVVMEFCFKAFRDFIYVQINCNKRNMMLVASNALVVT